MLRVAIFLMTVILGTATGVPVQEHPNQDGGRELILDQLQLFDGMFCANPIESLLGNSVNCTCTPSFFPFGPLGGQISCQSASTCFADICGNPVYSIGLNLRRFWFPVKMNLCFANVDAFSFTLPESAPICLRFNERRRPFFFLVNVLFGLLLGDSQLGLDETPAFCDMEIGGDTCSTCSTCTMPDGDDGVMYDCSNIAQDFVARECSPVGVLPRSFADAIQVDSLQFPAVN